VLELGRLAHGCFKQACFPSLSVADENQGGFGSFDADTATLGIIPFERVEVTLNCIKLLFDGVAANSCERRTSQLWVSSDIENNQVVAECSDRSRQYREVIVLEVKCFELWEARIDETGLWQLGEATTTEEQVCETGAATRDGRDAGGIEEAACQHELCEAR
jgi:hypothetical protein